MTDLKVVPEIDLEAGDSDLLHFVCCEHMPEPERTFCGLDATQMEEKWSGNVCIVCKDIMLTVRPQCPVDPDRLCRGEFPS